MAFASLAHLTRRGEIFYFRRAIPKALVGRFGRHEIKVSLQTDHRPTATIRCRDMSNAFERWLERVDGMADLTQDQMNALLRTYFSAKWAVANEISAYPPEDRHFEASVALEEAVTLRERATSGEYGNAVRREARELLENNGHPANAVGLEEIGTLCTGILRAQAEQRRILAAMLQGRFDEAKPTDPLFAGMASPGLPPIPGAEGTAPGDTLAALVETYRKSLQTEKYPTKTIEEKARVLAWLCDFVGASRPIKSIRADEIREFRDTLRQLPAHFTVRPQYKGKTLRELAALEGVERLSPGTVIKNFSVVRAFFQWATEDKYVAVDPSAGMSIKSKTAQKRKKKPFSADQLVKFFGSPMYAGCSSPSRRSNPGQQVYRDAKYWVPLIALFSGMRMGEILQLSLNDLKADEQVWYFDVNKGEDDGDEDEAGKSLKTENSVRVVPVHPFLLKAGFLDFVSSMRKQQPSDGRIFSALKAGDDGSYSKPFSKWVNRYIDLIGITDRGYSFHSFRHTFIDAMRNAKIEDSCQYALVGHASKAEITTTQLYGTGYKAKALYADMAKIDFGLDLSHLCK